MKKILFVCTGNICRSPTAYAIARHKIKTLGLEDKFYFDSAGLAAYHAGESPDPRSQIVGWERNISFDDIIARQITKKDFLDFDLIIAMDQGHKTYLIDLSKEEHRHKIKLFLEFCQIKNSWNNEVIDPYYLQESDFSKVFDVLEKAVDVLIKND